MLSFTSKDTPHHRKNMEPGIKYKCRKEALPLMRLKSFSRPRRGVAGSVGLWHRAPEPSSGQSAFQQAVTSRALFFLCLSGGDRVGARGRAWLAVNVIITAAVPAPHGEARAHSCGSRLQGQRQASVPGPAPPLRPAAPFCQPLPRALL